MYLSSRETLTRQDWGKKTLGDFFQNERELDNLDWGNSQKKLKIFGLTISRAREFEQMQEFPPPHFFSPIQFGGSPLPDCFVKALRAAVQFRSDDSKCVCASSAVPKRSKVCLWDSATFVPFWRVFHIPPPTLLLYHKFLRLSITFLKKFKFFNKKTRRLSVPRGHLSGLATTCSVPIGTDD